MLTNFCRHSFSSLLFLGKFKVGRMARATTLKKQTTPEQVSPLIDHQTRAELNTYLEVIPPNKVYELVESKQHNTKRIITALKANEIDQALEKDIQKHLLKNVKFLKTNEMRDIIRVAGQEIAKYKSFSPVVKKLYKKVIDKLQRSSEDMPLEDLINIAYTLAKANKRQQTLMRLIQNRAIEDILKIDFKLIKKVLFSFTHLNLGTTTLYAKVARTIKIGQHEFDPLQLAQFAYYLSKVQDNAVGGFGVFRIAQERLLPTLSTTSFDDLVDISHYMLLQNLGSNYFQHKLEECLYNRFPTQPRDFNINTLISLLKSTSGYLFKFKDNTLLQILENASLKYLKFCTLQQADEMLWSWGRSSRGCQELWQKLQAFYLAKVQLLKPRGLCFASYSFSRAPHRTPDILDKLQTKFSKINPSNLHYRVKFLQGLIKRQPIPTQLFIATSKSLVQKISELSNNDLLNFLAVLNDSDFHYESQQIQGLVQVLQQSEKRLKEMMEYYKTSQLVDILYLWVKLNIQSPTFCVTLLEKLTDINSIPKKSFLKALFSFTIKDQYSKVFEMLGIIYHLRQFGPIGYFFKPSEYSLLAYSVYHLAVNGRLENGDRLKIEKWLLDELEEYLGQMQPGILNDFEEKVYKMALEMITNYKALAKEDAGKGKET